MYEYKAPLRDIRFVLEELLDCDSHYQSLPGGSQVNRELRDAIFNEAAKFSEQILAPLRRSGDEEGCSWSESGVSTPSGFIDAYRQYVDGGWPGLSMPEEFGGQGLPLSVDLVCGEFTGQANQAWAMYPGLSSGCRMTISAHGTEQQRQTYLPNMVSGNWTGTMCLTEPQCGSDLSFLKTRAAPNDDGSYAITGTKIFISAGEHDMAENIVHLVLARVPGAPEGTRGISLFIVPKFLPTADGHCGERNAVHCGSVEHKMGIHANATCVMNFDAAKGFLLGELNRGLNAMFTFMNTARIGTASQGMNHAEVALQGALNYAKEREAGRSLSGVKAPDRPADPLIVHPDVRRMLLTIRAFAEGGRAFAHYLAQLSDHEWQSHGDTQKNAKDLLAFLTPIAKGFMTETGLEAANLGMQVYGGHGFIREWGMEQNLRDARISTLYEGTTGIQSLDLLGRKTLADGGASLQNFIAIIEADLQDMDEQFSQPLTARLREWQSLASVIGSRVQSDLDELGAVAVDYLMYSGYVVMAWFWGRMGTLALARQQDEAFYAMKLATAQFYFGKLLPRTLTHKACIESGVSAIMSIDDEQFTLF
jgi:alkylation response protein AidB-like acyl-CoA dehydrogenase